MPKSEQLCWSCLKACGLCPWSEKVGNVSQFQPVSGWKAKKVPNKANQEKDASCWYEIVACPLYERDPRADSASLQKSMQQLAPAKRIRIIATCTATGEVRRYESVRQAERAGFDAKSVRLVMKGMRKTHRGWMFAEYEADCCKGCSVISKRSCQRMGGTCWEYEKSKNGDGVSDATIRDNGK